MLWMFFGAGFYSYAVGSLSQVLINLDSRRSQLANKIVVMDEFCKETKLAKALKLRIRKALEYTTIKNVFSSTDKNEFLGEIPTDLKFEVSRRSEKL